MGNNLEKHNMFANKLIKIEEVHLQMVKDLVDSVNKLKTLRWVKFSRELDYIKDLYRSSIIDIILDYKKEFETINVSNTLISDKMRDFGKVCNDRFDEIYEHFESINGLK